MNPTFKRTVKTLTVPILLAGALFSCSAPPQDSSAPGTRTKVWQTASSKTETEAAMTVFPENGKPIPDEPTAPRKSAAADPSPTESPTSERVETDREPADPSLAESLFTTPAKDPSPVILTTEDPGQSVSPSESAAPDPPEKEDLVALSVYLPEVLTDLRYAGEDNFTGKRIYETSEAYLRYGTVEKLRRAAEILKEKGLVLKIWDAFRPVSAQFRLWEICPDPRYVADPTNGFSNHSRGGTVDLTLCGEDGGELEMPSSFDDFTSRANRDYSDCSVAAARNARLLEEVMTECGFFGYFDEWWHYVDNDLYEVVIDARL